jgi:hypothetical protein
VPTDLPAFQQPISVPDDVLTCGFNDDTSINRDDAYAKIIQFCANKNQTSLAAGPVVNSQTDGRIQSGLYLNITITQNPECKDETDEKLDADYCTQFLLEALDSCDTQGSTKHGGIVQDECATYILQPWDSQGDLVCKPVTTTLGLGVNRDNAFANINDICGNITGGTVSPNAGYLREYRQDEGDSNMVLQIIYNPTCPRGAGATRTLDKDSCVKFFQRLVDGCDTNNKAPFGKYGGNLTDECEVYKMDTSVLEEIQCADPTAIFAGTSHAVDQQTGQAAIDDYCNTRGIGLKSPQELQNQGFVQFSPDTENYSKGLSGWVVRIKEVWDADPQKLCKPATAFSINKDECERKYGRVLKECLSKYITSMYIKLRANCLQLKDLMAAY